MPACQPVCLHTTPLLSATNHPSTPSSDPRRVYSDSLLAFVPLFRLLLQRDKGSLWTSESSLPAYCSATREDESRSQLGLYVHPRCCGRVARAVIVELCKQGKGEEISSPVYSPCVYIYMSGEILFSELISFELRAQCHAGDRSRVLLPFSKFCYCWWWWWWLCSARRWCPNECRWQRRGKVPSLDVWAVLCAK